MLGASDLHAAMREFARKTGVRPQFGGVHPGRGTENAVVSLGDGRYVEIIAPDPAQHGVKGFAADLAKLRRVTPLGWAVGTDNAEALRSTLRRRGFHPSRPSPGSRQRPDGVRLAWVTFDIPGTEGAVAPFFIQWRNAKDHPSRTAPVGCQLTDLQLQTRRTEPLKRLVALLRLPAHVVERASSRIVVTLDCPAGRVVF
jgi:hypothetical protein